MSMDLYGSDHDQMAGMYHFGVKGMKWGVHRAEKKTANRQAKEAKPKKKKYTTADIKNARALEESRVLDINNAAARANIDAATGTKKQAQKSVDVYAKKKADYDNDPQTVVAAKMTRGEKALAIGLASVGGTPVAGIAVAGVLVARERNLDKEIAKRSGNK